MLLCIFFLAGAVSATTIKVTPTSGIQNAINNDSVYSGDTLSLTNGYYKENNIKVSKSLTITGPKTSTPTAVIDAQGKGRVFNISNGVTVTLKYLKIMNGDASKDTSKMDGGGIQNGNSKLIIINCTFINNKANYGGAIYNAYSGTVNVINSSITNNDASTSGGGICNDHGGKITVASSKINYNNATHGGGISNSDGSSSTVTNSNIEYCTAYIGGGIKNNVNSIITIIKSNISNNKADYGTGIFNYRGTCIVTNSEIYINIASDQGGGIYNDGNCTVTNSKIYNNYAESGGGIDNINNCTVTNSTITNNIASYGGGISNSWVSWSNGWSHGNLYMNNSKITNNEAQEGGGIANHDILSVIGCSFSGNTATNGKALHNQDGDTSNRVLMFNRFYDGGNEIYSKSGDVRATMNWWGSNANPANKIIAVTGTVYASQWLILTINATKTLIKKGVNSTITADLNHYKTATGGIFPIDPTAGHIINGIPITFKTTKGSINSPVTLFNSVAKATLTTGTYTGIGTANVTATLDSQVMYKYVTMDTVAPTIASITPTNGATGVSRSTSIIIKFSEAVKWGTSSIVLQKYSGTTLIGTIPTSDYTKTLSSDGKTLTIKPVTGKSWPANTTIKIVFNVGCVTDYAGNSLIATSRYFKTTA